MSLQCKNRILTVWSKPRTMTSLCCGYNPRLAAFNHVHFLRSFACYILSQCPHLVVISGHLAFSKLKLSFFEEKKRRVRGEKQPNVSSAYLGTPRASSFQVCPLITPLKSFVSKAHRACGVCPSHFTQQFGAQERERASSRAKDLAHKEVSWCCVYSVQCANAPIARSLARCW